MDACSLAAWSCAAAAAVDAASTRPGLTSLERPRRDQDPWGYALLPAAAYEACLCSCRLGYLGSGGWTRCWLSSVERLAPHGNPGMGMLFLMSLQAAATGAAAGRGLYSVEHVMGFTRSLLEAEGVEGAEAFYRALRLLGPSYLGRIGYSRLPDAAPGSPETPSARGVTLAELADEASLYDPVLRDAARMMEASLGALLPEAWRLAEAGLPPGRIAWSLTLQALALEGDLLLRRKLGARAEEEARRLASEALRGSAAAEARLWRLLRHAGPGSAADLAANTMARLVYEMEACRDNGCQHR